MGSNGAIKSRLCEIIRSSIGPRVVMLDLFFTNRGNLFIFLSVMNLQVFYEY